MFRLILDAILGLFDIFLGKKQDLAKDAGRLEQSNEQLKAAAKQKDEALDDRLETDDRARGESDADALGRLR